MSWILAFETSTEWCSVALARLPASLSASSPAPSHPSSASGPACLVRHEQTGPRSSSRVLPAAGELLAEAGIALCDCAAIAFGAGPGSFTGLRTACGVAQGLAFGADLPVVPVNTLMACAELARAGTPASGALPEDAAVLVALDARMDEAYTGAFRWDAGRGDWAGLGPMRVCPPEGIELPAGRFWLAGNAPGVFGDRLSASARAEAVLPDALPHAAAVAAIAARALARGETVDAAHAAPLYIRDKVAQTIVERQAAAEARAASAATEGR